MILVEVIIMEVVCDRVKRVVDRWEGREKGTVVRGAVLTVAYADDDPVIVA